MKYFKLNTLNVEIWCYGWIKLFTKFENAVSIFKTRFFKREILRTFIPSQNMHFSLSVTVKFIYEFKNENSLIQKFIKNKK